LSKVARIISEEIASRGAITFARFMELALYCPNFGYYETEEDIIGRKGDFFTSVSVGNFFGELLAWQFGEWLLEIERARKSVRNPADTVPIEERSLCIIEGGAHNGRLAKDILKWLCTERKSLYEGIQYLIIEPSVRRRSWQEDELREFGERVRWVTSFESLIASHNPGLRSGVDGIIFSNELLDSFPVHRYGWDPKKREWFEWGVTVKDEQFVWTRLLKPPLALMVGVASDALSQEICIERSPTAESWWGDAARVLHRGKLLTFDYGFMNAEAMKLPSPHGTIRSYHKHQLTSEILANPGEQDLTAHVNFPRIQQVGEMGGLRTEAIETQERFLTKLFGRAWNDRSISSRWTPERSRQFQTLVYPEHLGTRFSVLLQAREK
jgi:SAM-dependent MidA family methyltransferase